MREARVMASIADSHHLPFLVSFTADDDGNPLDGHTIEEAEIATRSPYRIGIGINCCGIDGAYSAVAKLNSVFNAYATLKRQHIVAYPNGYKQSRQQFVASSGIDTNHHHDGNCEHHKPLFAASEFAQITRNLHRLGATLIGGCCGTTPEHTREYVQALTGGHLKRRLAVV